MCSPFAPGYCLSRSRSSRIIPHLPRVARAKPKRDRCRSSRRNRRPVSQVMGPPTKAAARHPRQVRNGAMICASGGQAVAAVGVSTLQKGGVTSKGDMIVTPTTPFSQRAEPAPLWFGTFPKCRIKRGTTRIPRVDCGKADRGCASRVPLPPGVTPRRTGGVLVVRATPWFLPLVRHERRERWTGLWPPFPSPRRGSLSPQ